MTDTKVCDWLIDNADAPIRYRTARELLKDDDAAKKVESELLENATVQKWLANLKPHNPPQHRGMEHGCFDFCLENAMPKCVQLGLHGGMPQIQDAVKFYIDKLEKAPLEKPFRKWDLFFTANFLCFANVTDEFILQIMLGNLDELYNFAQRKIYDIYISPEEKAKLTGIPKNWKDSNFIKPELYKKFGYCYPLIYDIVGMHTLYNLKNPEIDEKVNGVINYISTDEFHKKISDGYGILISGKYESGNPQYHGMGWDPKYPGWFDAAEYMENVSAPKLLFFAQIIVKYPPALKTKWFADLLNYLDKYKTENGTYIFPKEWLKESPGYAVQGHHISFGENRRKKNWCEIESTFYMQLLRQTT